MATLSSIRRWSGLGYVAGVVALVAVGSLAAGPAWSERTVSGSAAGLEKLLSKIKAEHSGASILKIEREAAKSDGQTAAYEVKLLRPDGQVLKLYYDASTLELVQQRPKNSDDGEGHRRRERRRGEW